MTPSHEEVEARLRDLLQMADIMMALLDRCERELSGIQRHFRPGVDLVEMTGLSLVQFQAYEVRGRVSELTDVWEESA